MDPVNQRRIFFVLLPNGDVRFGATGENATAPQTDVYATQGYADEIKRRDRLELPVWGCLTQVLVRGQRVEILTDHVGAYPLYEAVAQDWTIVVGGDAWEVARRAGRKRLNAAACFDLLAFEYVPGNETLVDGLSEISPGTRVVFEFVAGEWKRSDEIAWQLQRDVSGGEVSNRAAFENLMSVMAPLKKMAQQAAGELPINLSGGWDSRAVLAGALRNGARPTLACLYGNPKYPGIRIARRVADTVGLRHELAPFYDGSFLRDNFERLIAWMPPTARFNLADGALAVGQTFYGKSWAALCGHNGDAFTKIPPAVKGAPLESPENLAAVIARVMWGAWRGGALDAVLKPVSVALARGVTDRVLQSVEEVYVPGAEGFFRWKTRNRVRRAVAGELRMLERFTPVVLTPLLDRNFIEFWMTVPDAQLLDQRLYRQMMFGELFTGDLKELGRIPRESGTLLHPDRWLGGARDRTRANYMRVMRRVRPGQAAQMGAADPTAFWWESDRELREWAWGMLSGSDFILEHFRMDMLRELVLGGRHGMTIDRTFAGIGVWNLLTVPGVERELAR